MQSVKEETDMGSDISFAAQGDLEWVGDDVLAHNGLSFLPISQLSFILFRKLGEYGTLSSIKVIMEIQVRVRLF